VQKAYAKVAASARAVQAANTAELNSARLGLQSAAKNLPKKTTVGQALTQLQPPDSGALAGLLAGLQ